MKFKFVWLWIILLTFSAITYGQANTYQVYSYEDMGFKVAFPNPPTTQQKQGKYSTWQYRSKSKDITYCVVITKLNKKLKTSEQIQAVNSIFKVLSQEGNIKSSDKFSQGKGMNAKFINADEVYVQCRIFAYEDKIYQLLVLSDNMYVQDRKVKNYFESFSVL